MSDAWSLARDAAAAAGVDLRACESVADAERILRVMTATWGDAQQLPVEEIRALAVSGNVPLGAFEGTELVGYVLGWAGVDADGLHVHSHMLAALPERRHGGIGYALKLAQRAQALDQGIRVVRWTFDPLVARNAYFNLQKLGAIADRFERDFYGQMADELNRGDRSDRFTVRWDLTNTPGPRDLPHDARTLQIPPEYQALRRADPAAADAEREAVAAAAESLVGDGLVGAGFDRARSAYLFVPEGSM
jgi:predicted GNAT superfamily acetyltransferase